MMTVSDFGKKRRKEALLVMYPKAMSPFFTELWFPQMSNPSLAPAGCPDWCTPINSVILYHWLVLIWDGANMALKWALSYWVHSSWYRECVLHVVGWVQQSGVTTHPGRKEKSSRELKSIKEITEREDLRRSLHLKTNQWKLSKLNHRAKKDLVRVGTAWLLSLRENTKRSNICAIRDPERE